MFSAYDIAGSLYSARSTSFLKAKGSSILGPILYALPFGKKGKGEWKRERDGKREKKRKREKEIGKGNGKEKLEGEMGKRNKRGLGR